MVSTYPILINTPLPAGEGASPLTCQGTVFYSMLLYVLPHAAVVPIQGTLQIQDNFNFVRPLPHLSRMVKIETQILTCQLWEACLEIVFGSFSEFEVFPIPRFQKCPEILSQNSSTCFCLHPMRLKLEAEVEV